MSSDDPTGAHPVPTQAPAGSGVDARADRAQQSDQETAPQQPDEGHSDGNEQVGSAELALDEPNWASVDSANEPDFDPTIARGRPSRVERGSPTTALPSPERRPRPVPPRLESRPAPAAARAPGRRRARLALQRLDPWSVFLFSLLASICLGIVLLVAVAALFAALSSLGVLGSLNDVLGEITGDQDAVVQPVITSNRVLGATAVLAAVDVVLLTALATLGALLYNACAALTGGIEVVLSERD